MKESGEESDLNIFWIWKESINIIFLFKFIRSLTRRKDNCIQNVIVRIHELKINMSRNSGKIVSRPWGCLIRGSFITWYIFFKITDIGEPKGFLQKKKKKRTPKSRLSLILSGRESPWKWSTLQTRFSSVTVRIYLYGPG